MRIFCPACKEVFESDQPERIAVIDHELDCHREVAGKGTIIFTDLSESTRLLAGSKR